MDMHFKLAGYETTPDGEVQALLDELVANSKAGPGTKAELISPSVAREMLRSRSRSRAWWFFIVFESTMREFSVMSGDLRSSSPMEVFVGPGIKFGVAGVACCEKSGVPPDVLEPELRKRSKSGLPAGVLEERDWLFICARAERSIAIMACEAIDLWLNSERDEN